MSYLRMLVWAGCLVLGTAVAARADDIRFPIDGFNWYTWPNPKAVGDCFGNCGASCSDNWNPCGGRHQYWELRITSTPQPTGDEWWDTFCDWETLYLIHYVTHQAWARWTYYGYASYQCMLHDAFCPEAFIFGCLFWFGCGPGWNQEWSYDTFILGDRRADFQNIGTCYEPRLP